MLTRLCKNARERDYHSGLLGDPEKNKYRAGRKRGKSQQKK